MCNRHHTILADMSALSVSYCPSRRKVPWHLGDTSGSSKNLRLCPGKVREVGNPSRQVDHSGNMKKNILRLCPGKARQVGGWSRREVVRSLVGGDDGTNGVGNNNLSKIVPAWCRKEGDPPHGGKKGNRGLGPGICCNTMALRFDVDPTAQVRW